MIDFIEYVVGELKSKRLSKTNAIALVRQFSLRAPASAEVPVIHPLLHVNTSDLGEQRYSSMFTGHEFFLADHQVKVEGRASQKVLPGVAYLEMARAAIEQATSPPSESLILELRNTVWARPIVVSENKEISIALIANAHNEVDYEIYSGGHDQEIIHCQGRAVWSTQRKPTRLSLEQLKDEMGQGTEEPRSVYETFERMGLIYGPAFQCITALHSGKGQALAHLQLLGSVAGTSGAYVLHPGVMDGAVQAALGVIEGAGPTAQPQLPFALETLRIFARCTKEMVAWVRYAPGSQAMDKVVKVDIDLCDEAGNLCVQMHGLSSRVLSKEIDTGAAGSQAIRSLLAAPVWEESRVDAPIVPGSIEQPEHHVVLCELSKPDVEMLQALLPHSQCLLLEAGRQKTIAERYSDFALACFERIKAILHGRPQGQVLFQVVVVEDQEDTLLAGLSGLLKTAALENPRLVGQLIRVPGNTMVEELGRYLEAEKARRPDPVIRYGHGVRQVLRWREVAGDREEPSLAFKDEGVYLITGGLGGLGMLFAREILKQVRQAKVILAGRSTLSPEKQTLLERLSAPSGCVSYRQVDLCDTGKVRRLIGDIQREYGRLSGILHCAGQIADNFILKKSSAEFSQVLAPKVSGTCNLDQATKDVDLDFLVLFSSLAGALGNVGQADYAAGNGFMDQFAAYRNGQVAAGQRRGRTRSINWGLWQAGGMKIAAAGEELLEQTTGIKPMPAAAGIEAFYSSLALPYAELLAVEGDVEKIRRGLFGVTAAPSEPPVEQQVQAAAMETESLAEKTQDYLRKQFSTLLKLPSQKIDPQAPLENYGMDSMLAMKLTNQLEQTFGSLSKTLFFEYQTICELTSYFTQGHSAQLTTLFATPRNDHGSVVESRPEPPRSRDQKRRLSRLRHTATSATADVDPIAIIGLSGRYPEAADIEAYWRNLRDGKDCIVEVPRERWDWREYFSEDRTKSGCHFSKWGGFIAGVDEFDPLFFNMSPAEAELVDPQERLFLQHAWMALEDAGYTRATLREGAQDITGQSGVYVGLMYSEYQLLGAEASLRGKRLGIAGSAASIANRVSYVLNLHGPSMTLDTMCSSSLTAIHVACQDLKQGRTSLAIAGGVNVSIHPNKYLLLSAGQFISSDGHCQSFGEGGDGYIPGEGVGVVVLKRLSEAKRDGDHIYGIIRGSALTHGGKTNGYTVPNPQAQAGAISHALAESHIDARHISYIEAHGTGTRLGDPIEIAALRKAFLAYTHETGFCLIGSAKSNIGHCESAAGIAGLTKVLLQMQHRQIVPSLHSGQLNPHIDFAQSPFVVNQQLRPWEQPVIDGRKLPRIAGVSSFGAGGSNAHLIVEEYQAAVQPSPGMGKVAILLSARTAEQLRQKARDLLEFVLARLSSIDLVAMGYTLQVGREGMEERLGLVVDSVQQVAEKLAAYVAGEQGVEDAYRGQVKRNLEGLSLFSADVDLQQTIDKWMANKKLSKLLELWVSGLELDWNKFYGEVKPRRMSLPAYPFARERCWVDTGVVGQAASVGAAGGPLPAVTGILHPLVHQNTSDLSEQRYSSAFTGEEFFLSDHQVAANGHAGQKVLPGVAYLEIARAAIEQAWPSGPEGRLLELQDLVWAQPIMVAEKKQVGIALRVNDQDELDYEIYSREREQEGDNEIVHCQGRAIWSRQAGPGRLDLEQLKGQMTQGRLEPDSVYGACAFMGLIYGPSFQAITALHQGSGQVLAQLRLPREVEDTLPDFVLHPSLLDGALQAAVGLMASSSELPSQPRLPFALEKLRIVSGCSKEMFTWVRYSPGSYATDNVVKLDIDLCDEQGNICVQLRGFSSRTSSQEISKAAAHGQRTGSLLATPVWQPSAEVSSGPREFAYTENHVVLCELARDKVEKLGSLLPHSLCLSLEAGEHENIAQRYSEHALACFERIQAIFQSKPQGRVLVQIVITDDQEQALLVGLSGLLKTAAVENPQLVGQLILVPADMIAEELGRHLQEEKSLTPDTLIRYDRGVRHVCRWQEVPADPEAPPIAFEDHGIYLITGGLGGLGILFAKEILAQTREAKVLLTGRSAWSADKQSALDGLSGALTESATRLSYMQVDLTNLGQVQQLIGTIRERYSRLNGILHCAGQVADNFILKKSAAEFHQVLAPKVAGTFNLDQATRDMELDFFVLFSSIAGAFGNIGQCDYATANAYMDQFAVYRNGQVAAQQRYGRTRSINWPLWRAGGMGIDAASWELLEQATGIEAMQTGTGMDTFYRSVALPYPQMLVIEGDLAKIRRTLLDGPRLPAEAPSEEAEFLPGIDAENLAEKTQDHLRREFSGLLKLPPQKIDPQAPLENYGIDSILAMKLTNQLEHTFGLLSKTLFFEYQTIRELTGYFMKAHPQILLKKFGALQVDPKESHAPQSTRANGRSLPQIRRMICFPAAPTSNHKDIAVIGLAGRYPQAENLEKFWKNLQDGRDCITEIPAERWNHKAYYDPDKSKLGKTYSKWGGFIADVDKFDPLLFNMSPKEAELIDPQERLFLETVWEAIEDAGYTKEALPGARVGVFVGVMWGQYELFGAESILKGNTTVPVSSHASVANRVSYFFDLHGPSIALDTMCSSSLTAIHMACEELRKGEIEAAIAGGVNLTIHPYKYLSLSQGRFVASDGKCKSFGEGGDGYVPGEGVGAVLLKPLSTAIRDRDQIYAIIKSSTVNHGGKTNGYTVPNPNAQADLILDALQKANVDPMTLSYIETHGTGTSLGDPIEITGLSKAFAGAAQLKQFCPIGSVKSNIGHLESAAGIAAVTKALLQIRHKQLVPSLHAFPLNPNINFQDSPFYVQTRLAEWKHTPLHLRRVGVSSFGAGGSNAHLILEEHPESSQPEEASHAGSPEVFVLSARDHDALCRYAGRIIAFLHNRSGVSLADLAYTAQVGRTPMQARLAVVTSSLQELADKLKQWVALQKIDGIDAVGRVPELEDVFSGNIKDADHSASSVIEGPAGRAFLEALLANRDLPKIARLWTLGFAMDWSLMCRQTNARRVSLPTYPFARERCWVKQEIPSARSVPESTQDTGEVASPPPEDKRRTYYELQWRLKPLAATEDTPAPPGPILVLDTSDGLFVSMKRRAENGSIVLLKPGKSFHEIEPDVYTVDPEREGTFVELVENLKNKIQLPGVVIHHFAQPCPLQVKRQVAEQLNNGLYMLFNLCKALMKDKRQAPLRILSVFSSFENSPAPLGAAMAGFLRTLALENPKYRAKVVDVQISPEENEQSFLSKRANLIWDELCDDDWSTEEIRHRQDAAGGEARTRRYASELVLSTHTGMRLSDLPLRKNGVYLITGGLGGLGFIFAEYLAKYFQSRLVLVGRSTPNAWQKEKLNMLEGYGAEILVLQADVSSLEDMGRVVSEVKTRFAALHGVLHSAGVNCDAFILHKTRQDIEAVLAPKVYGAVNLDLATSNENLDLFILFSSLASVMGNLGQSDYAFANHFLDSFAEMRESLRLAQKRSGRTLSINWPFWEEGGMGISRDDIALLEKTTGMFPLKTHEGIQYWEDFLRSDTLQGIALYGIPSRIAAYVASKSVRGRGQCSNTGCQNGSLSKDAHRR
jgi:polyketide synthase PksN